MPSTYTESYEGSLFKGKVAVNTGLFIDGEYVDPVDGETIEVLHPCSGKAITSVSVASRKDVDIAVNVAQKAYKTSWGRRCAAYDRGRLLNKLADIMEQHVDELCALESLDTGKNFAFVRMGDFNSAVRALRFFAGWADKNSGKTIEVNESKFAYTRHEPIGVVGIITPWNFPLALECWKIAPALATGNCVILKPSEMTPLSALKLAEYAKEAGFPPGVFNVLVGYGHDAGQALVEHPDIGKVAFTGSTLVGRKIMEVAAKSNLKRVSLELGGKSPTIIFEDADLKRAVELALHSFTHSGQLCGAGTRFYVQESIHDKFVAEFAAATQRLKPCDFPFANFSEGTHSPVISKGQYERVMAYIASGKEAGANVAVGGERFGPLTGYFIQPTIFTDVTPDMKIVREEIFGPVVALSKFKDEAEVIDLANATSYGLSSVVLTENINRALRMASALESGSVFVNGAFSPNAQVPFGGIKQSGFGKDLGDDALKEYTIVKAVHINITANL